MTDLSEIFAELGISHYLHIFIDQGFDTWDTILDITESDFDVLGVKLGHRRKLQRKIANSRGLSSDRALASPTSVTPGESLVDEQKVGGARGDAKEGSSGPHGAKRKYRRHPRPDDNAPERPPSAYVIFSNKMREDLKGRNLSFTEIAKLVGENWQNLSPTEKEPYEHQAFTAKERYNNELAEYKKTQEFKDYSQYLADFKQKQNQQLATEMDVAKRPKLEPIQSATSTTTTSSGGSQSGADFPTARMRVDSSASSTSQWHAPGSQLPSLAPISILPTLPNAHKAPVVKGRLGPGSPTGSPTVLPSYRDTMLGPGAQHWREGHRDESSIAQQISRTPGLNERRDSHSSPATAVMSHHLNPTNSAQHSHRTRETNLNSPPMLTSESTTQSSSSVASNSSMYFAPRTPLEPDLSRALPIPPLYPQKSGSYDGQLAFLSAHPSLSPQTSILSTQQSPNGIGIPTTDFPTTMAPIRRYSEAPQSVPTFINKTDPPDPRLHNYVSTPEENELDPVSALLRAGEIVNRNSRGELH